MQRAHLEHENIISSQNQARPEHAATTTNGMDSETHACSINE